MGTLAQICVTSLVVHVILYTEALLTFGLISLGAPIPFAVSVSLTVGLVITSAVSIGLYLSIRSAIKKKEKDSQKGG